MQSKTDIRSLQLELMLDPLCVRRSRPMTPDAWMRWLSTAAGLAHRRTYHSNAPYQVVLTDAAHRLTVDARCELAVALALGHTILDGAERLPDTMLRPQKVELVRPSGRVHRTWELGPDGRYSLAAGGAS